MLKDKKRIEVIGNTFETLSCDGMLGPMPEGLQKQCE